MTKQWLDEGQYIKPWLRLLQFATISHNFLQVTTTSYKLLQFVTICYNLCTHTYLYIVVRKLSDFYFLRTHHSSFCSNITHGQMLFDTVGQYVMLCVEVQMPKYYFFTDLYVNPTDPLVTITLLLFSCFRVCSVIHTCI